MADSHVSPERILQVSTGGWAAGILATGVTHSIFTHIEKGAGTVDEVAGRAGISKRGARALLDGLVGLGFLTVSDGRYHNAPDAAQFLIEGTPAYFGGFPKFQFAQYADWLSYPEIVRSGEPKHSQADVPENPFWSDLVPAIVTLSVPVVHMAAERLRLAERGPLSILDVGGGAGVYSMIWLGLNRQARSTQIDWSSINRIARDFVGRAGAADRFRTIDGDFHTTDFGSAEYDLAVYSHIAHMESPEENIAILKKLRRAIKPGGSLVISDFVVENDRSGPSFALIFCNEMLIRTRGGGTWSYADYEAWLRTAGFQKIDFQKTGSPATLVYAS